MKARLFELPSWTGFILLVGCSSSGDHTATGTQSGDAAAGGARGGIAGGGGMSAVGSGGAPGGDGGVASAAGGQTGASGGTPGSGGLASSTGGQPPSAGGAGGSTSSCYVGPTTSVAATDYVSRKWARWPMPTPPSMGLPHPMTYTDLGNGTVRDEVTGLVWQKTVDGTTRTWADAIANCENLTLDGGGWSLPTRIELTSILDDAQPSGPRVNSEFFQFTTKAGWTWASTPWVVDSRKTVDPPLSWFINFSAGDSNNSLSQLAASAYDRCVRAPTSETLPTSHYAISNGEVTDNYTCLVWQQDSSAATPTLTWEQAEAYCAGLALNGHSFRLPSLNELASLVDDVPSGDVSPAVDHVTLPNTSKDQWYWTATPSGSSTTDKWSLNFLDGFTKHQATSVLGLARCVR